MFHDGVLSMSVKDKIAIFAALICIELIILAYWQTYILNPVWDVHGMSRWIEGMRFSEL